MQRQGFSFVELSIVLAIIGLLIGGILAGRSILQAGERRSIIAEYQRYDGATQNFANKYNGLPGDLANATSYFGDNSTACSDTNTDGSPGTCNGDGDGTIEVAGSAGTTAEMYQYWVQLAYSGFVGGRYTGLAGAGSTNEVVFSGATANAPTSKVAGAGWVAAYLTPSSGSTYYYYVDGTGSYNNSLQFGAALTNNTNVTGVITAEDAWNIDTKLDDGRPATGKVIGNNYSACGTPDSGATASTNLNASYNRSSAGKNCFLVFRDLW